MDNNGERKNTEIERNVEFLYKTMMARDPNKRRVKPVQPHLLQLDFGAMGDSSDDSDFKLNSDAEDEDDDFDDEDDDSDNGCNGSGGSEDDENNSEDDDDDESVEDRNGINKSKLDKRKRKADEEADRENNSKKKQKIDEEEINGDADEEDDDGYNASAGKTDLLVDVAEEDDDNASGKTSSLKKFKVPICSVCLGDSNSSTNEIVECDGCFVSVHEGCFGVSDTQSTSSSDSSSSMEPWFCDACKAGVKPHCELCPNLGGIFKETDAGRWVHLICALYTPGIAFGDVEKLNNITLFEMPYSKWGAKECSLCEDPRFSRVGVCISCDAGMCRVHFHVTCAQREGLLTEAAPDEDIADPYFAYCKIHADKLLVKQNHRNWLALQSNIKSSVQDKTISEAEKIRLRRKLNNHQTRYQQTKAGRPPCWVPKEKLPRMLLSNSYALKQLLRKAELQGVTDDLSTKDLRKKGYVAPAFSVDFVSYYHDRTDLMEGMKTKYKEMLVQSNELRKQDRSLTNKREQLKQEIETLTVSSMHIQKAGLMLWDYMMNVAGKRIRIPECVSFRNFARSPVKKDSAQAASSKHLSKCAICKQTHDQHLMANCDRCHENYHLGCLDPPLTRMPKKTKSQGWQCSYCSKDPAEEEEKHVEVEDVDKPRRLREKSLIKEPLKYTTQFAHENKIRCQKDRKMKRKCNATPGNNDSITKRNHVEKSNKGRVVGSNSPLSISSEEENDAKEDHDNNIQIKDMNNGKAAGGIRRSTGSRQDMPTGAMSGGSIRGNLKKISLPEGKQLKEISLAAMNSAPSSVSSNQIEEAPDVGIVPNTQENVTKADIDNSGSDNKQQADESHGAATTTSKSAAPSLPHHPCIVTIFKPGNQGGTSPGTNAPLKRVIIAKRKPGTENAVAPGQRPFVQSQQAIVHSRQPVPRATILRPPIVASAATFTNRVRVVSTGSAEKKVPIIIRRKQPLISDTPQVTGNPVEVKVAFSPQPSARSVASMQASNSESNDGDNGDPIEISDDET